MSLLFLHLLLKNTPLFVENVKASELLKTHYYFESTLKNFLFLKRRPESDWNGAVGWTESLNPPILGNPWFRPKKKCFIIYQQITHQCFDENHLSWHLTRLIRVMSTGNVPPRKRDICMPKMFFLCMSAAEELKIYNFL